MLTEKQKSIQNKVKELTFATHLPPHPPTHTHTHTFRQFCSYFESENHKISQYDHVLIYVSLHGSRDSKAYVVVAQFRYWLENPFDVYRCMVRASVKIDHMIKLQGFHLSEN